MQTEQNRLEKVSFIIFLLTIILTPLAFLPTTYSPLDIIKTAVIAFGIIASSLLYFISTWKNKTFYIPKHPLVITSLCIIVSVIISTFTSASFLKSTLGQGFEIGTMSFIVLLFLSSLITFYLSHNNKDRVLYIYGGIIISFLIIALFHLIRLLAGADAIDFGIFQSAVSTLLGKWSDLALYAGVVGILSYIAIQFLTLKRSYRVLLFVLLAISAIVIFIVNSLVAWFSIALVMLGILFLQYFSKPKEGTGIRTFIKRLPKFSATILIIAVIFTWKGDMISKPVTDKLNVTQKELALPWQLSLDVMSATIKESPLFGAGPNRFTEQFLRFKPLVLNNTLYWNVEFGNGFGLIPTFIVTQGIVGGLLWLIFIILFAYTGFKALKRTQDDLMRFFIGSSFFGALFLWVVSFIYVPSHYILLLAFVLTGLFVASSSGEQYNVKPKVVSGLLLALIVVVILWGLVYIKKIVAIGYFQGGIQALNVSGGQNIAKAEGNFKKSLSFDKNDIYYQALSEINILKINALTQQIQIKTGGTKAPDQADVAEISRLVEEGIGYSRNAIAIDPTNYYNYVAEARISEVALSLQVQNAYENLKTAYGNALSFNPYNPSLYLNMARIEASQNHLPEAQQILGRALQLKQDYIEAIFLLSQIQVSQGKIADAITSVKVATQINPQNPLLFFQLGLLHYNNKDYTSAVDALSQAIKLDNAYANAKYFLGLSYARLGKSADAIIQFEDLALSNPDNEEIILILSNLKAGKSAFADATPPIDNTPEKRKTLPVSEN